MRNSQSFFSCVFIDMCEGMNLRQKRQEIGQRSAENFPLIENLDLFEADLVVLATLDAAFACCPLPFSTRFSKPRSLECEEDTNQLPSNQGFSASTSRSAFWAVPRLITLHLTGFSTWAKTCFS